MRVLLMVMLLLGGCRGETEAPVAAGPLEPGDPMPAFTGVDLAGNEVRIGPGEPVTLLNLWATWCGPCIEEMPELEALRQRVPEGSLRVVGLNVDATDAPRIRAFVEDLGVGFTIALDPSGTYSDRLLAMAMPSTYLVDAEGRLVRRWTGMLMETDYVAIERYLGG